MQEYARQLKRERELRSWSQEQVAEKLGTSAPNVSRWERGKTFPDTYYRQKLCDLFGKSAAELGLLQKDTDEKSEQAPNHPAVAQDSTAPVLGVPLSPRNKNRQRMLAKVQAYWISGVLEQSLHGEAMIALGLHEQPSAITDPWTLVLNQQDQPARPLPPGTPISQVYDEMGGELLMLGEPGSGKTTLLLTLTRELLDRARKDETHPIPVVFNLSSWATRRQPLAAWLSEELNSKYQVPRKLAKVWIEDEAVLPLLDGLDEVSTVHRAACVEVINHYRQEHGLVPVVICSRSNDYFAQTKRVLLRGAVVVQPLTEQQVDDYLLSGGKQLAAVRVALDQDSELQALATTPLMLSVLTLAYAGVLVDVVLDHNSSTTRQRQVIATYVECMLQRRRAKSRYTSQQAIRWLTWLAQQLVAHNQTEFYIERLQPDWLETHQLHKLHVSRLSRFAVGFIFGLVGGVIYGLFCGILLVLINFLEILHEPGLPGGLPYWWQYSIDFTGVSIEFILIVGLVLGVIVGLVSGLIVGAACRLDTEIKPTEALIWSWAGRWRRRVVYVLGGMLVGELTVAASVGWVALTYALVSAAFGIDVGQGDTPWEWRRIIPALIIAGLTGGVIGLLMSGWSGAMLDKQFLVKPNQGIWRSTRRAAVVGLISAVIGMFFFKLSFSLPLPPDTPFAVPVGPENEQLVSLLNFVQSALPIALQMVVGLVFGLAFTFYNGGFASIKHLVLRLFLWHAKLMPWKYPRFLDDAANYLVLRKVGGGYIFMHRLLLEYFSSLDDEQISNEKFRPISKMNTSSSDQMD